MFAKNNAEGIVLVLPFGDGWFRAIAWDRLRQQAPLDEPVTEGEMRDVFHRIAGEDFGMSEMRWSSRFLSERKQAASYREGRVFLAGDAAHVHSPLGGQGMNTGIGDAVNLGWKLAEAVRGTAPGGLLDTYQSERHPVGDNVLRMTDAFNKLMLGTSALRRALQRVGVTVLLNTPIGRRTIGGLMSGIGITYARPRGAHALVGTRLRDVQCGSRRLYERMRSGAFVLLTNSAVDIDMPGVVTAVHADPSLPAAILVRPDGYVAWASDTVPDAVTLRNALRQWTLLAEAPSQL